MIQGIPDLSWGHLLPIAMLVFGVVALWRTTRKPTATEPDGSTQKTVSDQDTENSDASTIATSAAKRNYRTEIVIVPDVEDEEADAFLEKLVNDSEIRAAGIVAYGRAGAGDQISKLYIQSYRPPSRDRILRLAQNTPIEIEVVDLYYDTIDLDELGAD